MFHMSSLRAQAFSAVRSTASAGLFRIVLQLVQLGILARLLTPADFGLVAMAMAVIGPAMILCDFGLGTAIIQRQGTTSREFTAILTTQLAAAAACAVSLALGGQLLARGFDEPRLAAILLMACPLLVLAAAGQPVRAVLERELAFGTLALIETAAAIVGFAISVHLARMDWGAHALVLGQVAAVGTATILMWLSRPAGLARLSAFRPGDIRPFLRFGTGMLANGLLSSLSCNADTILGGRLLQSLALGHFQVVRDLCLRVDAYLSPIVGRVGLPLLAKAQHDPPRLGSIYLTSLLMTTSMVTPVMIGLGVFAEDVVAVLLGPGWGRSVVLLQLLAAWGLLRSAAGQSGILAFATGRIRLAVYWNVGMFLLVPLPLWFGASMGGDIGLAAALLAIQLVVAVPNWAFLIRPCAPIPLVRYLAQLGIPLLCAIPGALAGLLVVVPFAESPPAMRLVIGMSTLFAIYLATSAILNRKWLAAVRELVRLRTPNRLEA